MKQTRGRISFTWEAVQQNMGKKRGGGEKETRRKKTCHEQEPNNLSECEHCTS